MNKKYNYPRIIQIMPCENTWLRWRCDDLFSYTRAPCLALVEEHDDYAGIYTDVRYFDCDDEGIFLEDPGYENVYYCSYDLSDFTHSIDDTRPPLTIIKEGL